MSTHTPGPWGIGMVESHATPEGMIGIGPVLHNVALVETRHGLEEGKANARLIAAAPALLEALVACEDALKICAGVLDEANQPGAATMLNHAKLAARAIATAKGE